MEKEKLIARLMTTFLGELEEHARAMNRDLLVLEKDPGGLVRPELCKTLFRSAHSLKGAARSVAVGPIETACHRMEGIIADIRDGLLSPGPELFQLMFATVDAIEDAGRRLREGSILDAGPLVALLPRLERARESNGVPAVTAAPPAPAAAAPVKPVSAPRAEPSATDGQVRIPAAKLDGLLASAGELLVARRRLEPRSQELEALLQLVRRWRQDWRQIERPLRKTLEQSGPASANGLARRTARVLGQSAENLERTLRALESFAAQLATDQRAIDRAIAPFDENLRHLRMAPFAEACEGLERAVRDIAKIEDKQVDVVFAGTEIELDRAILDALKDPLLHLVRNAVDHGLETPSARQAAGKSPRGQVRIEAALRGDRVQVVVADDGRGLDLAAIREAAARRELPAPEDEKEAARLLFLPGFSTARALTEVSGRGVGMDIVKSRVEALHGSVTCRLDGRVGLAIVVEVPLTLTTARAVLLTVGGQIYAIPQTSVQTLLLVKPEDLRSVEGREVLALGGAPVPLVSLAEVLGTHAAEPPAARPRAPVLVLAAGEERAAFSVDELLAEQEIVLTSLGRRLRRVRHFSGATLLPSGRIALVLNAADLIRSALRRATGRSLYEQLVAKSEEAKRLLIVDDSVTTRTLVKSLLESAGYDVQAAADGAEAWRLLQERGVDLVVSDVEMPRMDGFELTGLIRKSPRLRELPVILVTALDSDQDRARGMEAGASAYLVKSAFDQKNLLETVSQLL